MKTENAPQPVFLNDYKAPEYFVDTVEMHFDLHEETCGIRSRLAMRQNPNSLGSNHLRLNGEELKLEKVLLDGRELQPSEFTVDDEFLTIPAPKQSQFTIETWTRVEPQKNLAFDGLFKSGGNFLTQCEPEGFRRMTYFPDRPDVMARFTVTVEADKTKYPVLLSNGNRLESRDLDGGRHMAKWQDPFPKPSYLFALVAGDFGKIEDTFRTRSGRDVKLEIYCKAGHEERCRWAMTSLQRSMKWDEDTFGLEYDLDIYMIVVTDDFNMGAMENKGLNIFNSIYVLANPQTATDTDYHGIQAVVGHEYFHNWTGNRVTCRDWFQLSLKEGLTVFRDQQFSADMTSHAVRRIEEVARLRTDQFAEDAGPQAHPIRPSSYIEINNFYTRTIYEKGAEVIRMIHTIIGDMNFRKGMDKYFELHDGQAVRTEDFVQAMELASGMDLSQFKHWYEQAGTPVVTAVATYNATARELTLKLSQRCPPTPGQPEKNPFHIPVALGLIGPDGKDMRYSVNGGKAEAVAGSLTQILHLKKPSETFVFENVATQPVLSLLRGFSAPVRLEYDCTSKDLSFQIAHDGDAFCRWEAAQKLMTRTVQAMVAETTGSSMPDSSATLLEVLTSAYGKVIADEALDPALKALLLEAPAEPYLAQFFPVVRPKAIHEAREQMLTTLARAHQTELSRLYAKLSASPATAMDSRGAGLRAVTNSVLSLLVRAEASNAKLALEAFRKAQNMTAELGALAALNGISGPEREQAMNDFHAKWKNETLVINKWLQLQAVSPLKGTLERVKQLSKDSAFDETNPNKVGSLYVRFGTQNPVQFHDPSGAAYQFLADRIIEIDGRNPQLAARLASVFNPWKLYEPSLQALMKTELERIRAKQGLSKNVFEIVSKALA